MRNVAKINLNNFEKVHSWGSSDSYILRSIADPKVYMGVKCEELFQSLLSKRADELVSTARAYVAKLEEVLMAANHVKGISTSIDPRRLQKNFKDAMSREDRQEWAVAYDNEYQGFFKHQTLKIARPEPGAKILGSTTWTEYKVVNGVFEKRKVRL